jgi:soluble lytic murein transglycosylase
VAEFQYAWPQGDDDRWWKSAFPPAYLALLQSGAEAAGIPWTLAAAVTREESGFEARIESYAHALGLMQLLLKTAAGTAGRKLTREEVFDPRTNIELGTKYLRGLLDETGHPALAVAAYNCGPGGVRRSLREYKGNEIDEMVEHIGYDQTRRYTKRVMSSAWAYQYLYGGEGVVPFPLTFERTLMKDRE